MKWKIYKEGVWEEADDWGVLEYGDETGHDLRRWLKLRCEIYLSTDCWVKPACDFDSVDVT